jgi:hypothetical protein
MRIFNAISSWVLWNLFVFNFAWLLCVRLRDTLPEQYVAPTPPHAFGFRPFWYEFVFFTIIAALSLLLRHRFWFRRFQHPGFGFWALSVLFYCSIHLAILVGFGPYVTFHHRGATEWVTCFVGIVFALLGFPRLPSIPLKSSASF